MTKHEQIDIIEQHRQRYEERLRKILKIKDGLLYNKNTEFGEIGSWIIIKKSGIKDALKVIIEKASPIYIHNKFGSAVFKWDYINNEFITELWSDKKLIDNFKTPNALEIKSKMENYWKYCSTEGGVFNVCNADTSSSQ